MIEIQPTLGLKNFRPGDEVTGRIRWELSDSPAEIVVSLIWHTRGRGSEDAEREDQLIIANQNSRGEVDFKLKVPAAGPWSYSGSLISIVWVIEVVTTPATDKAELEIVIGPEAKEIVMHEA